MKSSYLKIYTAERKELGGGWEWIGLWSCVEAV